MTTDSAVPDRIFIRSYLKVGLPPLQIYHEDRGDAFKHEFLNREGLVKQIEKEADACLSMLSHNAYSRVLAIIKGDDHG